MTPRDTAPAERSACAGTTQRWTLCLPAPGPPQAPASESRRRGTAPGLPSSGQSRPWENYTGKTTTNKPPPRQNGILRAGKWIHGNGPSEWEAEAARPAQAR